MRTDKELAILAEKNPEIADIIDELLQFRYAADPKTIQCDLCFQPAIVEGWIRHDNTVTRTSVCRIHCNNLVGFEGKTNEEINKYLEEQNDDTF